MGSTVSCAKKVGAMRAADGRILYALFEETYEKNCHPHRPRWSCVAFGLYEEVLAFVFSGADAAASGCLQNRGGWMSPESYIRAWLREFQVPVQLHDAQIRLQLSNRKYPIYEVECGAAPLMIDALLSVGRSDLARQLELGSSLELQLYRDLTAVRALLFRPGSVNPWRALDIVAASSVVDPSLAPSTRQGEMPEAPPAMLALCGTATGDGWVLVEEQGRLHAKRTDLLLRDAIRVLAYRAECCNTGAGVKVIAQWRSHLEDLPQVGDDARCTVTVRSAAVDAWQSRTALQLAREAGLAGEDEDLECFTLTAKMLRGDRRLPVIFGMVNPAQIGPWSAEQRLRQQPEQGALAL